MTFIGTQTESRRYLAEALLDLDGWDVTGITTINRQELESYRDLDRSPYLGPVYLNLFDAGELQTWDDYSVELRVASPQEQPIRGTVGGYYFNADNESFQREFTGFCNRVSLTIKALTSPLSKYTASCSACFLSSGRCATLSGSSMPFRCRLRSLATSEMS